jgi:hypothetical protein
VRAFKRSRQTWLRRSAWTKAGWASARPESSPRYHRQQVAMDVAVLDGLGERHADLR